MDFSRTMSRLPDEGLIEIAFSGDQDAYVSEAVAAAKAEVARRKLSPADISTTITNIKNNEQDDSVKFLRPLSNGAWLAFVIFGPTTISFFIAIFLGVAGYKIKCKEAFLAIFTGFAMWSAFFVVIGILLQLGWIH